MIRFPNELFGGLLVAITILECVSSEVNSDMDKPDFTSDSKDNTTNNKILEESELDKGGRGMTKLVNQLFGGLVILVILLKYLASKVTSDEDKPDSTPDSNDNKADDHDDKKLKSQYRNLKLQYFPAYFAAIFGDWLQGPYVYKLYSEYGFQENHIAILFLTGFGSSFTFGTFTGPLADKFGRKSMTQVFCVLYSLSCVIKFSSNFWILICGRICAGIATSLLFR